MDNSYIWTDAKKVSYCFVCRSAEGLAQISGTINSKKLREQLKEWLLGRATIEQNKLIVQACWRHKENLCKFSSLSAFSKEAITHLREYNCKHLYGAGSPGCLYCDKKNEAPGEVRVE